jgi:hypothetical protein
MVCLGRTEQDPADTENQQDTNNGYQRNSGTEPEKWHAEAILVACIKDGFTEDCRKIARAIQSYKIIPFHHQILSSLAK